MLVNWNLLVSAVKLVSFERVTCSFVGVTCSFVSVTCSFVNVTCSFVGVTCSFVSVTCSFVGVTCSFDPITFRFVIPKWWILQIVTKTPHEYIRVTYKYIRVHTSNIRVHTRYIPVTYGRPRRLASGDFENQNFGNAISHNLVVYFYLLVWYLCRIW